MPDKEIVHISDVEFARRKADDTLGTRWCSKNNGAALSEVLTRLGEPHGIRIGDDERATDLEFTGHEITDFDAGRLRLIAIGPIGSFVKREVA